MKLAAASLLASVLIPSPATGQSCTAKPDSNQFHMSGPKWGDPSAPTLPGRTVRFELAKNTNCYPWYIPCPGYTIQACDTIAWSFGDGTTATTSGESSKTHRFDTPGLYGIEAKVTNPNGSAVVGTAVLVAAEPLSYVTFSDSIYSVSETAGSVSVKLRRTGDTTRRVTVEYRTGFAIGTVDSNLEVVEGSVVFEPGDTTKTFSIPVIDDQVYNGDSQHSVWIGCDTGDALLPRGIDGYGDIRIVEDEPAPIATAPNAVRVVEGNSGATLLKIPVTLSKTFDEGVDLWWTIWEESARRTLDWAPPPPAGLMSGGLTIPAGETRGELAVLILGDSKLEPNETFRIEFVRSGVVAVVVVGSPIRVTIVNDDLAFSPEAPLIAAGQNGQLRLQTGPMASATTALLESSDPAVLQVPASIAVAAGTANTTVPLEAGQPGAAVIQASLADTTQSASVRVTVYQPLVPSFERRTLEVGERRSTSVGLQIDPPPASSVKATLRSSLASLIQFPATVMVPTSGRATISIEGRTAGKTTLTATLADTPGQPSATVSVTVVERDRPTLASVSPPAGPTTGGTTVTLRGENFTPACTVLFGPLFATVSSVVASTIVAVAPPHAAGTVDVSLACGSHTAVLSNAFQYVTTRRRAVR